MLNLTIDKHFFKIIYIAIKKNIYNYYTIIHPRKSNIKHKNRQRRSNVVSEIINGKENSKFE